MLRFDYQVMDVAKSIEFEVKAQVKKIQNSGFDSAIIEITPDGYTGEAAINLWSGHDLYHVELEKDGTLRQIGGERWTV